MWGKAIHLASTCRAFRFPRHCTCAARAEPRVYVQLLVRLIVSLTHETGRILPQMKVIMSSVLACLPFFFVLEWFSIFAIAFDLESEV